ncbi:MAG: hypothetical protein GY917_02720, partial [Planctomycetaceae bacterium]|nr:hypothetical protein [Planctomycetaceae bacterium]
MNFRLKITSLVVLLAAVGSDTSFAAHLGTGEACGVAKSADCCAKPTCHTVMKTRRQVVYEKQQQTCYRTVYETVYEDQKIDCVKNVQETRYRNCEYTVCKPVYETRYRTV